MNIIIMFNCSFCSYVSNRKFCVKQHENNIHFTEKYKDMNKSNKIEKQTFNCSKCGKDYLLLKNLKEHERKCIGINALTCPKCMKSFNSRQNKSKHIKNNSCESRSIIYVKPPIIIQNITNNNYNITINNYGNERLDYLTSDDMLKIIMSYSNSVPLFIEKKHFNKDFPENHNIKYDNKSKKYTIKENDEWRKLSLYLTSVKIMKDNSQNLLNYCEDNKEILENKIKNDEIIELIIKQLLALKIKNNNEKLNKEVLEKIKNLLEEQI